MGRPPGRARESTVAVNGIPLFDGQHNDAVGACLELIRNGHGGKVATANLDFFALARNDAALREDLLGSTLVVADGMPVVWLAKMAGARKIGRTAGVDLVRDLCARRGSEASLRVAIYGSTRPIAEAGARYLEELAAGLSVTAIITPPFRKLSIDEVESDKQTLVDASPDLILVALGCPAQERLIATWYDAIPGALWIGVGGTFDFFAGKRKRAPAWAQRTGFEWLVRMAQDPRRLGRRYLLRDLPVLVRLAPPCLRTGRISRRNASGT
jgi:N-acetylglucosaminyldiphosphoundecaprenol N-acetyl-beta-D-mannosaminyltransferase